ncbi:MAG: LysR substrate-binding domain-containing protein [Ginsengibacter sp.]
MLSFRLKVFQTAAIRLNFTKTADELFISQPAVSKHIRELEQQFKTTLFDRDGSRLKLTVSGETLLQYTNKLFQVYNNLEFEMNNLSSEKSGQLRIGASTTIAQYVLPRVLAAFHQKYPDVQISLVNQNTEGIEKLLMDRSIHLGVVEGQSRNTSIKYAEFLKDEIVLVTSSKNNSVIKDVITIQALSKLPLLIREPGSGSLDVIAYALKSAGISLEDLKVEMQLASTESIKSYLMNSECVAFLSIHSVLDELKNNELRIIDVKGLIIKRYFYFIQPHGEAESISTLFIRFASHYNFR